MKPFVVCFIVFSFLSCSESNRSISEGYFCGSNYCSKEGGNTIQSLLMEEKLTEQTLPFELNIVWVSEENTFDSSTIEESVKQRIANLNQNFNASKLHFVIDDKINFVKNNEFTLEKIYEKARAENYFLKYGKDRKINIFIVKSEGILNGYTSVLTEKFHRYNKNKKHNAIFISNESFFNQSTLEHEMGHFFGLQHTFGGNPVSFSTDELPTGENCQNSGDWLCDTPADPNIIIARCKPLEDISPFRPDFSNFMSYYPNNCKFQFSPQQTIVINQFATTFRNYLIQK